MSGSNKKYFIVSLIGVGGLFLFLKRNRNELNIDSDKPNVFLANQAYKTWNKFLEDSSKMFPFLLRVWKSVASTDRAMRNIKKQVPWSAAFISYIMLESGYSNFPKSASHTVFASRIKNKNIEGFKLKRVRDYSPKVGDIVLKNRDGGKLTFDNFKPKQFSHSDIVVSKSSNYIITIGGNVGNTVSKTKVALRNGKIANSKYFAIIKVG